MIYRLNKHVGAGATVIVQFKPGFAWYAVSASEKGVPELRVVKGTDGAPTPVATPFLQGKVTDDGSLVIETVGGGKVRVDVDPDSVFAISTVVEPAVKQEESRIVVPGR